MTTTRESDSRGGPRFSGFSVLSRRHGRLLPGDASLRPQASDGSRLIVVSNRVSKPDEQQVGGLAAAVHLALQGCGGLWFGWSGNEDFDEIPPASGQALRRELQREAAGSIDYALLDLTQEEYESYYLGFANRALWPLFHFRLDAMQFERQQYAMYRAVNRLFAQHLAPLLDDDSTIWIHDYHLIPLAAELRALGVKSRIGFFLHVPVPPGDLLARLPCHADLFAALFSYDVVGVHTEGYAAALRDYLQRFLGASLVADSAELAGRSTRVAAFPISIDAMETARTAEKAVDTRAVHELLAAQDNRKLVIGVDRLDYSKGLPLRFAAFGSFLDQNPSWHAGVSLLQIAPTSRSGVPEYDELKRKLAHIAGSINSRHADPDWNPIRYINRSYRFSSLAGFYRVAAVGLVTPLCDGMNLVAKEFVASQPPEDPGVLILSRFAGAAEELTRALLVNPYDKQEIIEALERALAMPLAERRERWQHMFDHLRTHGIAQWQRDFRDALARAD